MLGFRFAILSAIFGQFVLAYDAVACCNRNGGSKLYVVNSTAPIPPKQNLFTSPTNTAPANAPALASSYPSQTTCGNGQDRWFSSSFRPSSFLFQYPVERRSSSTIYLTSHGSLDGLPTGDISGSLALSDWPCHYYCLRSF